MYNYGNYDYGNFYNQAIENATVNTGVTIFTGLLFGILIFAIAIAVAIAVFIIIANWKIFKKAGRNGWEAIIPVYNGYVMYEVCGYPGWYIFLGFIPLAGPIILFVFNIMAYMSLAKKFGKDDAFGVLTVFFPYVCLPILGFGSSKYDASKGEHKNTENNQKEEQEEEKVNDQINFCPNCGKKVTKNTKKCSNCNTQIR